MEITPRELNRKDAHELFMSAILPRPIAFVSTVGEDGILNLAAFSCFAVVGLNPALLCFYAGLKRDGRKKDTVVNIEFSGDFVVNIVDEPLAKAMNQASAEYTSDVDEFKEVGLTPVKSELVRAPRVAESPVNMECTLTEILESGAAASGGHIIMGEVVLVHVKDELWAGDQIEISKLKPIGRLGGDLYCRIADIFEMERPYIL